MSQITPVSQARHAGKKWQRFNNFKFAAALTLAPVVDAELRNAALAMPLAFITTSKGFALSAVLSLTPGRNMLVGPDGRWLGGYVPAHFRAHPFSYFLKNGTEEPVLGIDEESELVVGRDSVGEEFFAPDGGVSPALQKVVNFLTEVEGARRRTDAAVRALADASLVQPWTITLKTEQRDHPISGLHRVDETALHALGDDQFLKLRKASAFPIAYSQLLSMGNLGIFERLAHLHAQLAPKLPATLPESLDGLFGLQSDDTIKF